MERSLHSVLPPVSASILSHHLIRMLLNYWGLDRVATCAPLLFALLLVAAMMVLGCASNSFENTNTTSSSSFAISISAARIHSVLLLLVPGAMHIVMFRRRILSRDASFDELYDLVLVWTVPYLLHCGLLLLPEREQHPHNNHKGSPYEMNNIALFPKDGQLSTLRGALIPMATSLAASLAVQQRYLIPLCQAVSYQFNGHDLPSTIVVSVYLTAATLTTLFAAWVYGRKSTLTNEPLFEDYHEDIVQLSISASGLLLGKAFGMPWNLTPLPILAFLGLSVWVTTRMLRYLSIFLFVVHAAGVVIFSYRFAAMDVKVALAIPGGMQLGLVRFGMAAVIASLLVGTVTGLAVRPSGGVGASFLKRVDVGGILLWIYTLVLTILELTLLKRPVPNQELSGKESDIGGTGEDDDFVYDHATALLTSMLVIGVGLFSQRYKIISQKSAILVLSFAMGKAIAIIMDASEMDNKIRNQTKQERKAVELFLRSIVASLLFVVMLAPRAFLKPIHIKTTVRYKRSVSNGKKVEGIPAGAYRLIIVYSLVILPLTLIATIPYVLTPLVMALSAHYGGGAYYSMAPPLSEMIGFALTLWGISCLSLLNHYLPDGGGETWKKAAALTLMMGVGVALSAPTVPEWIAGDDGMGVSNPYASISSLGSRLVDQGRSRTGGWGILSASLATLLAITGPLELRERRDPSGQKDKFLLLRLMTFSIMFGSGVSWFIAIQSMSQEHFRVLFVTAVSCMSVSFFGTVAAVLGYFLELDNFDEVDQVARVWVGAFFVFTLLSGLPQLILKNSTVHAFGVGGWLSTYLVVCCCITLAVACVLRARPVRNQETRRLGNLSCVTSWVIANIVLYGQYGVAGLDDAFDVTTVMGISASVFGTFLVAPILLALEGEVSNDRRGRVQRVSGTNAKPPKQSMGFTLTNLGPSNRLVPLVMGVVMVFLLATVYTILLRGSFLVGGSAAKSVKDVVAKVAYGNRKGIDLKTLVEKSISNSQALVTSAGLAGSGIWTSNSILGPLLHLGGLVATLPSLFLLIAQLWSGTSAPKAQITLALPLNLIPLILCRGIPSLRAAAIIGMLGGLFQLLNLQRHDQRSHMRI
jgi:hypothetical protein